MSRFIRASGSVAIAVLSGCSTFTDFQNGYTARLEKPVSQCSSEKISSFRHQVERELSERNFTRRFAYFERQEGHFVDAFAFPSREGEKGYLFDEDAPRTLVLEFDTVHCSHELSDIGSTQGSVKEKRAEPESIANKVNEIYRSVFSQTPALRRSYE